MLSQTFYEHLWQNIIVILQNYLTFQVAYIVYVYNWENKDFLLNHISWINYSNSLLDILNVLCSSSYTYNWLVVFERVYNLQHPLLSDFVKWVLLMFTIQLKLCEGAVVGQNVMLLWNKAVNNILFDPDNTV